MRLLRRFLVHLCFKSRHLSTDTMLELQLACLICVGQTLLEKTGAEVRHAAIFDLFRFPLKPVIVPNF